MALAPCARRVILANKAWPSHLPLLSSASLASFQLQGFAGCRQPAATHNVEVQIRLHGRTIASIQCQQPDHDHKAAGVRWFEVDRSDVLRAKQAALENVGASFSQSCNGAASTRYPLKAESWTALEVDLGVRGWSQRLMAGGFDPSVPTVWLAEGLLMYLQPSAVEAMLLEMAGEEAPACVPCVTARLWVGHAGSIMNTASEKGRGMPCGNRQPLL